jgi:hypothetical protein
MRAIPDTAPARRRRHRRARTAVGAVLAAAALAAAGAAPARAAGFQDFSYAGVSAPTADKPQSKIWVNDGIWWASLWDTTTVRHEIYRLDWASQTWSSTGVPIDARRTSTSDVLWDGAHLYVASAGPSAGIASQSARVYRFSYDAAGQMYALDPGFPVTVSSGGMEAVVLAKDGAGTLWVTFTQNNQVLTAHSTTDDAHWSAPEVLPFPQATALAPDDIASIVAFDGKVGVMWSDQGDPLVEAFQFATHADGAPASQWSLTTASSGDHVADDHINLKALSGDPAGRVFAATKTSLTTPGATLQQLLVLQPNGTWSAPHQFGTVADDQTRSQVLIDTEHRQLYMFVSAPCCSGGMILFKRTSLASIAFPAGPATPLIQLPGAPMVNNPTSTKQSLTSATGLVVVGGDDSTALYAHAAMPLGPDARAPDTRISSGGPAASPTAARFLFTSDEAAVAFQCSVDGTAFATCRSPVALGGLAPGPHSFAVRAIDAFDNVDATPAAGSWTVPAVVTAAGAPAATGVPAAAARRRAALAGLRLTAVARQHLGRRGRLRASVSCRSTCRAVLSVRVRGVGRLHAVRRVRGGRTVPVVLRLTRAQLHKARLRLARHRRVQAVVTVTATDTAGRRLAGARSVVRLVR